MFQYNQSHRYQTKSKQKGKDNVTFSVTIKTLLPWCQFRKPDKKKNTDIKSTAQHKKQAGNEQ